MAKFTMIEFGGEEAVWAKIAAASAPFESLDFGDPASAALIAAAIPTYRKSGDPADLNVALAAAARKGNADSCAVVLIGPHPYPTPDIVILRTPTSGTEIKIREDGLVWVVFDRPLQGWASKIILRAAEMNVSVSASPEHGRHLWPRHAWTASYELIALAARELREARRASRVAADLVASAEDALRRAKTSLLPAEDAAKE